MKTSDFIKRLNIRFDSYALKRDWNTLNSEVVSDQGGFEQIGLTYTGDCEEDKRWIQNVGSLFWEKTNPVMKYSEKDFSVLNPKLETMCPYIWKVCNEMKLQFSIGRIRIMIMKPASVYQIHRDFERRWHLPIISPVDSFYYVRTNESNIYNDDILESSHGIGFHIPDDGFVYEIEAGIYHTAVNPRSRDEWQTRVHLLFNECF